jgi:hypothetical protein
VLVEEIGGVRDAARADLHKDTARGAAGATWQQGLPAGRLTGEAAVAAFTTCPIGKEQLPGEAGSDYFTSVATRTLGVAGSVAGGATAWKPLQPVLNTVRGVLLALYLLGRGVVSGSRTGNFAVALVLALGGALIALSLLGVDVPGLLTLLGATLLAAGALLGLVRGTPWRIALVVALYVATVAAYYGVQEWEGRPDWVDPVAVTGAVALLAVGATALGYQGRREAAN